MMLVAYAQACPSTSLQLWVGLFDTENPSQVDFQINDQAAIPLVLSPMKPIRDAMVGTTGKPLNHHGIFQFTGLLPDQPYRVGMMANGERIELATHTLPDAVPTMLDGHFNILLCSCYYQPEDARGLLGTVATQIKQRPDLTLMMGDQIYGDLPLFEDLPGDDAGVARKLGHKYRRNWASAPLGVAGLGPVLTRAPVVCVADDHEFWNNYPFHQTQLPKTWQASGREQWAKTALALYEDYQIASAAGGTQRIDVDPLKMLVVDMRCYRDEHFGQLMNAATLQQIKDWADDLIKANQDGKPAFGLLSSGQALFIDRPSDSAKTSVDAEMSNYAQFDDSILPILGQLADAGIPVVYVTGDVHWGRVATGLDLRSGRTLLHEVIASPSRLIRVPVVDAAREAGNFFKGIAGKVDPWPRHAKVDKVPARFGKDRRFDLCCDPERGDGFEQRGDQIAILSFARAGNGLDFTVSYYAISADKALAQSRTTRTFELRIH